MHPKEQLLQFCHNYINARLSRIQENIKNLQQSLNSETKSSAGDKHETGRAMVQLEREKLGQQLAEAEKTKQLLSKVSLSQNNTVISLGSLVKTSSTRYYLAISAGECIIDNQAIFCVSAATPIGKLLLGKTVGDSVEFNAKAIEILEVS